MFTNEDRKRSDTLLDKASKIGETIGIFLHNHGKGLIKSAFFIGCIMIVGGFCLLVTLVKKTALRNKK